MQICNHIPSTTHWSQCTLRWCLGCCTFSQLRWRDQQKRWGRSMPWSTFKNVHALYLKTLSHHLTNRLISCLRATSTNDKYYPLAGLGLRTWRWKNIKEEKGSWLIVMISFPCPCLLREIIQKKKPFFGIRNTTIFSNLLTPVRR